MRGAALAVLPLGLRAPPGPARLLLWAAALVHARLPEALHAAAAATLHMSFFVKNR